MNNDVLQITSTLPSPESVEEVLDLYMEAFGQKVLTLEYFTKDRQRARNATRDSIDLQYARFAVERGSVIGFIGLDDGKGAQFIRINLRANTRHFGWFGGTWRYLVQKLSNGHTRHPKNTLRIAFVAVGSAGRGKGVGTKLMEAAYEYAVERGRSALTLEVIDANPRARALYERLGFSVVRRVKTGRMTRAAGFEAFDVMHKVRSAAP